MIKHTNSTNKCILFTFSDIIHYNLCKLANMFRFLSGIVIRDSSESIITQTKLKI
jgi:hypothetical protein